MFDRLRAWYAREIPIHEVTVMLPRWREASDESLAFGDRIVLSSDRSSIIIELVKDRHIRITVDEPEEEDPEFSFDGAHVETLVGASAA